MPPTLPPPLPRALALPSTSCALAYHVKAVHTKERPFKCEMEGCGLTYMTKADLDRHYAKHKRLKEKAERAEAAGLRKRAEIAEKKLEKALATIQKLKASPAKRLVTGGAKSAPHGPSASLLLSQLAQQRPAATLEPILPQESAVLAGAGSRIASAIGLVFATERGAAGPSAADVSDLMLVRKSVFDKLQQRAALGSAPARPKSAPSAGAVESGSEQQTLSPPPASALDAHGLGVQLDVVTHAQGDEGAPAASATAAAAELPPPPLPVQLPAAPGAPESMEAALPMLPPGLPPAPPTAASDAAGSSSVEQSTALPSLLAPAPPLPPQPPHPLASAPPALAPSYPGLGAGGSAPGATPCSPSPAALQPPTTAQPDAPRDVAAPPAADADAAFAAPAGSDDGPTAGTDEPSSAARKRRLGDPAVSAARKKKKENEALLRAEFDRQNLVGVPYQSWRRCLPQKQHDLILAGAHLAKEVGSTAEQPAAARDALVGEVADVAQPVEMAPGPVLSPMPPLTPSAAGGSAEPPLHSDLVHAEQEAAAAAALMGDGAAHGDGGRFVSARLVSEGEPTTHAPLGTGDTDAAVHGGRV